MLQEKNEKYTIANKNIYPYMLLLEKSHNLQIQYHNSHKNSRREKKKKNFLIICHILANDLDLCMQISNDWRACTNHLTGLSMYISGLHHNLIPGQ